MQQTTNTYLKIVNFSNFKLWDVKRYYSNTTLEFKNVVALGDILVAYKKPISKAELKKNHWQIISKINFSGELFLRNYEDITSYKGNCNLVPDNSIIYSKINVRHGCIYFHEKGKTPFGVSNEYPVYTFDDSKVNGYFLQKLLRSKAFKNLLNTKTTGISKTRVKQDEFLNIQIPLPTLIEQEKIINAYKRKVQESLLLESEANILEKEIEKFLFSELGVNININININTNKSKLLQFIDFNNTSRWDTLFLLGKLPNLIAKFEKVKFVNIIKYFNKGENNKSIRIDTCKFPEDNFRYIGMEHIEKGTGNLLKLLNVKGKEIKSQTLRVPNDFFIYGKLRPYLNKYWINNTDFDNIICSSEFFVFTIHNDINKQFFKYILASKIIQNQISDKTSGARMPRINEDIFFNLEFPLPPKEIQKKIADTIDLIIIKMEELKIQAIEQVKIASLQFEQEIFS